VNMPPQKAQVEDASVPETGEQSQETRSGTSTDVSALYNTDRDSRQDPRQPCL